MGALIVGGAGGRAGARRWCGGSRPWWCGGSDGAAQDEHRVREFAAQGPGAVGQLLRGGAGAAGGEQGAQVRRVEGGALREGRPGRPGAEFAPARVQGLGVRGNRASLACSMSTARPSMRRAGRPARVAMRMGVLGSGAGRGGFRRRPGFWPQTPAGLGLPEEPGLGASVGRAPVGREGAGGLWVGGGRGCGVGYSECAICDNSKRWGRDFGVGVTRSSWPGRRGCGRGDMMGAPTR